MRANAVQVNVFEEIDRVEQTFGEREPIVRAFIPEEGRFARLRREAERLLEAGPPPHSSWPLYGMLIGVKDIFHVDGFPTRAGSHLPPEDLGGPEASCVSRLRAAGALIAGKTVTTEFAYFSPGPTRNPHAPDRTPGGSSSGSAAGVAASLCAASLGTQTIGSIIRPAAFCGVVGFKPSYGRVATDGVIPLSPSLDHVGLFARNVATATEVAAVLCETWTPAPIGSARPILGVPEGPYLDSASPPAMDNFQRACQLLQAAGYEIRHTPLLADHAEVAARHELMLAAEASRVHAKWFAKFADLYARKTAELIRRGQAISEAELARALEERALWQETLVREMERSGVDLWISPSAPGVAPKGLESTGDPVMNLPWTQAGLPALNLPAGKDADGLPFGLQVVGRPMADESLLGWAASMEGVVANA